MVQVVVKKSENDQFMVETECKHTNDALIRNLVMVSNMRLKVKLLAGALEELASYGPAKTQNEQGLDEVHDEALVAQGGAAPNRGPNYKADPTGSRTGEAPSEQLQQVLRKVAEDSKLAIATNRMNLKVPLTTELLQEKIDLMRGAVTMAYPMGLPKWDPIYQALADEEHKADIYGQDFLDAETSQLWWAGKEFFRDQCVSDRVGKNEKTKIVAKLQQPGSGPPAREPVVTEDERKAMMAHYFKKQEEMKQLAENDEDDYLNSSWANPNALKSQLQGTSNISWR